MRSRKGPKYLGVTGKKSTIFILILLLGWMLCVVPVGAEEVDDGTCLACHEDLGKTLIHTPHRLGSTMETPANAASCVSCHPGGEVHIDDPSVETIGNPARMPGQEAAEICGSCHMVHTDLDNYGYDIHSVENINCNECHRIHDGTNLLLKGDDTRFCLNCHNETKDDFHKVSNHPLPQNVVSCLDCHKFTRKAILDLTYDLDRICQDCHPQMGGPFLYQHDATNAWSVEGGSCLECHEPHGSVNDRLLKQPREQLCLSCHITPAGHISNSVHGYVWSEYRDCVLCHTDVHGSFNNKYFLDENLGSRLGTDCFTSGCHDLNH